MKSVFITFLLLGEGTTLLDSRIGLIAFRLGNQSEPIAFQKCQPRSCLPIRRFLTLIHSVNTEARALGMKTATAESRGA